MSRHYLVDTEGGIGFATEFGPNATKVILKGSPTYQPKTVILGEIINLYDGITHFLDGIHEGFFHPVKQENTKKKENQNCYGTIKKVGYAERTRPKKSISEGFDDWRHRVDQDQPAVFFRDNGHGIDDRSGIHEELHTEADKNR